MENIGKQWVQVNEEYRVQKTIYTDDYETGHFLNHHTLLDISKNNLAPKKVNVRFVEMLRLPTPHDTVLCSLWKVVKGE